MRHVNLHAVGSCVLVKDVTRMNTVDLYIPCILEALPSYGSCYGASLLLILLVMAWTLIAWVLHIFGHTSVCTMTVQHSHLVWSFPSLLSVAILILTHIGSHPSVIQYIFACITGVIPTM